MCISQLLLWTRMNPYNIKKIIYYCASVCWSRYQNNVTVTRVERRRRRRSVKVIVVRCCEYICSLCIYLCVQCWGGCCWLVLFIKDYYALVIYRQTRPLKILCIYMYVKIACWSLSVQVGVLSFYSIHQFSCLADCSVGERQNALISVPNYML